MDETLFPAPFDERGPEVAPRPYQDDAARAAAARLSAADSTIVLCATGVGKSLIAGLVARDWDRSKRVLALVHREELKVQLYDTFRAVCRDDVVEIEDARRWSRHHGQTMFNDDVGRIVVASKDSLYRNKRLRRWHPDEVGLMIVDECHHVTPKNKTYVRIMNHFRGYKRLGLTATIDRMDKVAARSYFDSIAYQYDCYEAIQDGWLVEIRQQSETVRGWDLTRVKRNAHGDFDVSHLDRTMREERPLQAIATAAFKYGLQGGRKRPTLIFCVSVDHAEVCADVLNRQRAGCAEWLSGEDEPERRKDVIERFRRGEFQFLCGCTLFTEGFDEPSVEMVIIGRPTLSRVLYAQMIGRGIRIHRSIVDAVNAAADARSRREIIRSSVKPSLLVIDMVGASGRHKLRPASVIDLLGGNYPPEVREKAIDMIGEDVGGEKGKDPVEILKAARGRLNDDERRRRRDVVMVAKLQSREVDPFDWLDCKPPLKNNLNRGRLAMPWMVEYLHRHDVPVPSRLSIDDASELIRVIRERQDTGPPSEKQCRVLRRHGFDADKMTFREARDAIDVVAALLWK